MFFFLRCCFLLCVCVCVCACVLFAVYVCGGLRVGVVLFAVLLYIPSTEACKHTNTHNWYKQRKHAVFPLSFVTAHLQKQSGTYYDLWFIFKTV